MNPRLWEWTKNFGPTILFVLIFTHGVAQATVVPTESMTPTILAGDHFFIDKVAFPGNYPRPLQKFLPMRPIERGEIVALWSPENPNMRLIKRVIGLPGETFEIRDRYVYIDGKKLDEPYAVHIDPYHVNSRDNYGPAVIPPDQFFMMGDNRDNSNDSRYWGFAPRESLIGKPLFVYWSYELDPYPEETTVAEWLEHSASMAAHFFSKTRWLRTGTLLR